MGVLRSAFCVVFLSQIHICTIQQFVVNYYIHIYLYVYLYICVLVCVCAIKFHFMTASLVTVAETVDAASPLSKTGNSISAWASCQGNLLCPPRPFLPPLPSPSARPPFCPHPLIHPLALLSIFPPELEAIQYARRTSLIFLNGIYASVKFMLAKILAANYF